jgi:hypothetical protein
MNTAPSPVLQKILLAFVMVLLAGPCPGADDLSEVVRVRAILGQAQLSKRGAAFTPLGPGMVLRAGDLIQTATGSAVDLYLGEVAGTVRVTESAILVVDKFVKQGADAGAGFDISLSLRAGELLGLSKPVPQGSRFEIKVSQGIVQILEGRFRVDSGANCVLTEGRLLVAHVPPVGEPAVHKLNAPPAVYFAPEAGVQPAPKPLVREVTSQMRPKLPRR